MWEKVGNAGKRREEPGNHSSIREKTAVLSRLFPLPGHLLTAFSRLRTVGRVLRARRAGFRSPFAPFPPVQFRFQIRVLSVFHPWLPLLDSKF